MKLGCILINLNNTCRYWLAKCRSQKYERLSWILLALITGFAPFANPVFLCPKLIYKFCYTKVIPLDNQLIDKHQTHEIHSNLPFFSMYFPHYKKRKFIEWRLASLLSAIVLVQQLIYYFLSTSLIVIYEEMLIEHFLLHHWPPPSGFLCSCCKALTSTFRFIFATH